MFFLWFLLVFSMYYIHSIITFTLTEITASLKKTTTGIESARGVGVILGDNEEGSVGIFNNHLEK